MSTRMTVSLLCSLLVVLVDVATRTTAATEYHSQSLCGPSFRPLEEYCWYAGITNIRDSLMPNAVYTTALVNGALKDTFVTDRLCILNVQMMQREFRIQIGNEVYPVVEPMFNITEGANGLGYITVDPYFSEITKNLDSCQKPACLYNENTMSNLVDFENCAIVGWGAILPGASDSEFCHVAIQINEGGCADVLDYTNGANTKCFKIISQESPFCPNYLTSAVYCYPHSSGEGILIGLTASPFTCNISSEVRVALID